MRRSAVPSLFVFIASLCLIALIAIWGQVAGAPAESITLPAQADTFVASTAPDDNFGDENYLEFWFDDSGQALQGAFLLFRFDVQEALGPDAIIESAMLQLYQIEAGGADPVSATLHPILEYWGEDEVTFDNQPDVYTGPFLLSTTFDGDVGWQEIDVTQYADDWQAGDNFGLELRSTDTQFFRAFESAEHNEREPQLVIRYHLAQPTPTATTPATATATKTATPTATATATPDDEVTLELCAVADATVNEASPTANYGDDDVLRAGYGQGDNEPFAFRSLARFDLSFIPPGSEIREATFEAGQIMADGQPQVKLPLYAVRAPWEEMGVTWANQPPVSEQPAATTTVDDGTPVIFAWEVRDLVQEWLDGGLENNGLELRGPEGGAFWLRHYDSRHYRPFCPRLVLRIAPNGPMPTPTALPTPTATATLPPPCPHADAAGNSFAQAAPLAPIQDTAEYLCPSGDRDYWKFPIESGQEIKLYLWGMTGDYDLTLLDPNGGLVKESALWGAGANEYISYQSYENGEFRAVVDGKGVADWHPNKPYQLRLEAPFTCFAADEAGNDFLSATEILTSLPQGNIQRPREAAICPEGDVDVYRFYVPRGQLVTMRIDLTQLPVNYNLFLRDPSNKLIASSTNSDKADERIDHVTMNVPGYWRVEVSAPQRADGSRPYHTAAYKLDAKLSSNADLSVRGIEITQAIQAPDNSVNLAAGKLTMARVYVGGGGVPGPLSGVNVKLRAWKVVWGVPQALPGEVTARADDLLLLNDLHQSRLNNTASVNMFLPAAWTQAGQLRLRADVNPAPSLPETDFGNNSATADVGLHAVQAINLGLVPVRVNNLVVNVQTDPDVLDMLAWTRQVYPTAAIQVWSPTSNPITANYNYNFPNPADGTCGDGWSDLLDDLEDVYDDWPNRPGNAIAYGVLHASVPPGGPSGCGSVDGGVSAGIMGFNAGPVLAHEMGHNYDRIHAPCGLPAADTPDAGYPTYLNPQGAAYASGSIGQVGIDTADSTVFDPQIARDLMSYCPNEWISPYTWHAILYKLPDAAQREAAAAVPYILVSGDLSDGQATFAPFWIQDRPAGTDDAVGDGPYSIRLLSAQGQVLRERRLAIAGQSPVLDHDAGSFREWLRYAPGTAKIVLLKDGDVLAEQTVSAHAPQVTVLSPNGGEQWFGPGPFTVRWSATDADGDSLTARVHYSTDGGATWSPLAVNLTGNQVALDTTNLPGGAARVRVIVTDGVNTAADASDTVFQVDNKPPLVFLLNPRSGTLYEAGQPVVLQATATDPEDGPLPDGALSWSLPGLARSHAEGNDVVLDGLPPGGYVFTVAVQDEGGKVTARETAITVGWRLFLPTLAVP